MTDGPFYPPLSFRARAARLGRRPDRRPRPRPRRQPRPRAAGELLDLLRHRPGQRRPADRRREVEIWQCDVYGSYRHPRGAGARVDAGFQGFGSSRSDARGGYRFRTIRPVPYTGRTPHIHVKLRHPSFGELTSQLFVAGDPGNAGDFLYRSLSDADREAVEMRPVRAPAGSPVAVAGRTVLIVGEAAERRRVGGRISRRRAPAARSSSRRRRRPGRRGWRGSAPGPARTAGRSAG